VTISLKSHDARRATQGVRKNVRCHTFVTKGS
jgi:hypothetical protein